jgi:hypothetical protein
MCASDETATALLLVVLEKRIQPTQLKIRSCENRNAASRKGVTSHREALDLIKHKVALGRNRSAGGSLVAPRLASVSLA